MGMFDYVKVNINAVPGSLRPQFSRVVKDPRCKGEFQTKCTECHMNTYRISADRTLFISKWNHDLEVYVESACDYTGDIDFYTGTDRYGWVEYRASFDNGNLVKFVNTHIGSE